MQGHRGHLRIYEVRKDEEQSDEPVYSIIQRQKPHRLDRPQFLTLTLNFYFNPFPDSLRSSLLSSFTHRFGHRRQKFAEGGPKISEHDLETWMVILRGRVRGRGGGEVQEGDVEWAVNIWKEGRANVE